MPPKRTLSTRKKLLFSAFIVLAPLLLVYLGATWFRGVRFYDYVKSQQRGWAGTVHAADPKLGFAPVPGARGQHVFPVGDSIAMRFDAEGLRVPVDEPKEPREKHPLGIAFGCSFTYGDACRAEDTWPCLVEQQHGGTVLNAGVCGYGLAQMLRRATELIPKHKPDYVLVQCSSWLVDRAMVTTAPSVFGALPNPYFCAGKDGGLQIAEPAFQPMICSLNEQTSAFRATPRGIGDKLAFFWKVALPLYVHDDWFSFGVRMKTLVGALPKPATDRLDVWRCGYGAIAKLCTAQHARCLLVIIRTPPTAEELAMLRALPGVEIVDAESAVRVTLPEADRREDSEAYKRAFMHWRGNPPVLADTHPNAGAHAIMAGAIVQTLRTK